MGIQTEMSGVSDRPGPESGAHKTVTVNGCEVAYLERGSGNPVIFVHGGISDLRIWGKQMVAFSENHRAIAYSRRYAWPNADVPDGVDDQMQPHVDDLAAIIQKLALAPAHLVGNSWGGFICLLTAIQHPELVRSITVEEPPVIPLFVGAPPKPQQMVRLFLARPRDCLALMRFLGGALAPATRAFKRRDLASGVRAFARGVLGVGVFEGLPIEVKEAMLANGKALCSELLGAGFPQFSEADARSIKTPTLLLTGANSPALLRRLTERLLELIPGAQLVTIPAASHLMHYEQPAAVNRSVLDFIARH